MTMTPKPKQAVAAIKLPVTVVETIYDDWAIADATGEHIARQILFSQHAHQIAHALNSLPGLMEALRKADLGLNDLNHMGEAQRVVKAALADAEKGNSEQTIFGARLG